MGEHDLWEDNTEREAEHSRPVAPTGAGAAPSLQCVYMRVCPSRLRTRPAKMANPQNKLKGVNTINRAVH